MTGIAFDGTNLWVSDGTNYRIREIAPTTPLSTGQSPTANKNLELTSPDVSTLAGSTPYTERNGTGIQSGFVSPESDVVVGNNLYVDDQNAIRQINLTSGAVTTLAGTGQPSSDCTDSTNPAQVVFPENAPMTTDDVALYTVCKAIVGGSLVTDLRRTLLSTGATSTVANLPAAGACSCARYNQITYGSDGYLYLSTYGLDPLGVVQVNPNTGQSSVYIPQADLASSYENTYEQGGITSDSTNLWITVGIMDNDEGPAGWDLYSIPEGSSDPTPTLVGTYPVDMGEEAMVSAGNYLYADTTAPATINGSTYQEPAVAIVAKANGASQVIAGGSAYGYQDGPGSQALFKGVYGLASDGTSVWAADSDNGRIRRLAGGPTGAALTDANLLGGSNPSYGCGCQQQPRSAGDPVDVGIGDYYDSDTDIADPGRGLPLDFTRTYNSDPAASQVNGLLGYGWSFSYGMSLSFSGSTATVTQENGSQIQFTQSGSSFTPTQSENTASLTTFGSDYVLNRQNQDFWTFNSSGQLVAEGNIDGEDTELSYSPSAIVVTDADGRTLTMTLSGGHIIELADSNSPARTVEFGYDTAGDLTTVTDVDGGVTSYGYSSSHQLDEIQTPRYYTGSALPTAPTSCSATPPPDLTVNVFNSAGQVACQWDADSRETTFTYGPADGLQAGQTLVTDPKGNETLDTFTNGELASQTQGYGSSQASTWAFGYDPISGAMTEVVDPNGHVTQYFNDPDGDVTAEVDAMGNLTTWTYNQYNEIASVTPPATYGGETATTTYTYDQTAYSSGGYGNLTTVSTPILSPSGVSQGTQVTHFVHADESYPTDVTSVIDPDGNTWNFTYDSSGDLTSETAPATTDNSDVCGSYQSVTKWVYNMATGWVTNELSGRYMLAHPHATSCTTPAVGCSTYTYNNFGQLEQTTNGDGDTTTNSYDPDGNLQSFTDGDNNVTEYTYDPAEELTAVTQGYGTTSAETSTTKYFPDGSIESQTNPGNDTTSYTYDPLGHVASATDPDNRTTTYLYDPVGNLLVTGQPGVTGCTTSSTTAGCTIYSYNPDNELTGIDYNDTATTPNVTSEIYDADGRQTAMTDGTGTSSWSYNSLGDLVSQTNGGGSNVGYGYDDEGNQTSITYPGTTGTVQMSYDAAGRESTVSDWENNVTGFTYNQDGDLTSNTDPTAVSGSPGTPVTDTFGYDNADNETSVTTQGSSTLDSFAYTLDGASQISQVTSTGVPSDNHHYTYNPLHQLTSYGMSSGHSFNYDPAADPIEVAGNTVQTFDPASQLNTSSQITLVGTATTGDTATTTSPKVTLPSGAQAGDEVLTAITLNVGTTVTSPTGYTLIGSYNTGTGSSAAQTLLYDHTVASGDTSVTFKLSAKVDAAAVLADYRGVNTTNPVDTTSSQTGAGASTVAIPSLTPSTAGDQLVVFEGAASSPASGTFTPPTGTTTETTQAAGTATEAAIADEPLDTTSPTGALTAQFSQTAQLVAVAVALTPAQTTYTYNPESERTSITPPDGSVANLGYNQAGELTSYGTTATYTYDGNGLRASKTVNGTTSNFTWDQSTAVPLVLSDGTNNYLYGPDGLPLEQEGIATGTLTWYHHDQAGSTRTLTNQAGTVVGTATYNPYGTLTASTGQTTPLGYDGYYTDAESGLDYLDNRYYDPATAEFVSVDPLDALTQTAYSYTGDNPLNTTDPSGLCWYCIFDPVSHANPLYTAAQNGSGFSSAIERYDPAYQAISGYADELQSAEDGCSLGIDAVFGLAGVLGVAGTVDPADDPEDLGLSEYAAPADGTYMSTSDTLDPGEKWLGPGYQEPVPGSGRFVSQDGSRAFRITEGDITGAHGEGPHANFEELGPNPARPGRMKVVYNSHVYFND